MCDYFMSPDDRIDACTYVRTVSYIYVVYLRVLHEEHYTSAWLRLCDTRLYLGTIMGRRYDGHV